MKRWLVLALLLALAAAGAWIYSRSSAPPEVTFARAKRETLVSVLSTNGKAQPAEWREIPAERDGRIMQVRVQQGQRVAAGAEIAALADPAAEADLSAAEARLASAAAALRAVERGGPSREIADIEGSLAKLQIDISAAGRETAALRRLVEKKAATRMELDQAEDRLQRLRAEASALAARRDALVERDDRTVAQARVREAEQSLELARRTAARSVLRAPIAGVVYDLPAHPGAWVRAGDVLARVGEIDRLRIVIFVDEPDLGRVKAGQAVKLTWDAVPDREWTAEIVRVPTQVAPLGTRQIGEVLAVAGNSDHSLTPGANINAEIRTDVVENAVTIPKEAVRRNGQQTGIYLLENGRLAWRPVGIGVSSITRTVIPSGLKDADAVALPSEVTLSPGMAVTPVFR